MADPDHGVAIYDSVKFGSGNGAAAPNCQRYLCRGAAGFDRPTGLGTPNGTSGLLGPKRTAVAQPGQIWAVS